MAKRIRKNHRHRIKIKKEDIATSVGIDVESICAYKVAISIKRRALKGEMLNQSRQSNSINQLYSKNLQLQNRTRKRTLDDLVSDIHSLPKGRDLYFQNK